MVEKFKLKKSKSNFEPVVTADLWYDIIDGGYVDPSDYLDREQARKVREAVELLYNFKEFLRSEDLIEDM